MLFQCQSIGITTLMHWTRTTAIFRITWLQNLIIQTVFYGDRSVILLAEKIIFITASQDIGGMKGIHYHQFLQSGENTLNLKLSVELYNTIISKGRFNLEEWLNRYTEVMLTPDWHNDTYIEEFHRGFFKLCKRQ